jgi:glycosyltransferase involved in cell wall biosynthesis
MKITVVIPTFNEEDVIPLTLKALSLVLLELREKQLCKSFEILVIDDGSTDLTILQVEKFANQLNSKLNTKISPITVMALASNHGQMKALEVGLQTASGDCVFTMDADLQDPPALMEKMLKIHLETGIPCVQAVRRTRDYDSASKKATAYLFYKFIKIICNTKIIEQAADFRLLAKKEARLLATLPAKNKAFRILIPILGIPTATIEFDRQDRAAGKSKYKFSDQLLFAWDCIFNFNRFRKLPLSITT